MQEFIDRSQPFELKGYPGWLASLLFARGVDSEDSAAAFLSPSLQQLHDPLLLQGMPEAVDLIRALGKRRARAVVYGDYDVDGLCASVIAKEALEKAGLQCIVYIPDRHSEGYGINEDAVRSLAGQAELLLTVDCGITAVDEVALAKALGLQVIVTDHHTPPDQLPPADAVINPLLGSYPFPQLCGAGTAWKLSCALHGLTYANAQLDLAALATIADLVPLLKENRVIASFGMKALGSTPRAGLRALMLSMGLAPGQEVNADRVAFGIAPRLNAGGRLTTAQAALTLLLTDRADEGQRLADELNDLNADRQAQQAVMIAEAEARMQGMSLLHSHSIVLAGEGWNPGIVGLVAGRLAERYGYPSVVLTDKGDSWQGSGRSAGDIDLYAALSECRDLFERFGGHRAAAGLALPKDRLEAFRQRFDEAVGRQLAGAPLLPRVSYDGQLALEDVSLHSIERLEQLKPFGMGNPSPSFLVKGLSVQAPRQIGREGKHLRLRLRQGSEAREAVAFGMGDRLAGLPPTMEAVLKLSLNDYQGRQSAECQIQAFRAGEQAFHPDAAREQAAILQDLQAIASNNHHGSVAALEPGPIEGYRGSLLICRCHETAEAMHQRYPAFASSAAPMDDRRGLNTILYGVALQDVRAPYEAIHFCDGLLHPAEAAYAASLFPGARIHAGAQTQGLRQQLSLMKLSVEELRVAYLKLRDGAGLDASWPEAKRRLALLVLEQLQLITLTDGQPRMLPLRKCDPAESRLFQLLI